MTVPVDARQGLPAEEGVAAGPVTELGALEAVAFDILSVREVDQVLLSIARHTLSLLESDMAGVFLREGDRLVMRSCVGHRRAHTARLCIEPGHGLAGRVLETAEPCKVDSYLESDAISHEFNPLALAEDTQSALGAPLIVHGEVIGVLEVWRRQRFVFSDRHVRRIVALANLAAIAIENARLYDRQQESVLRLAAAEASLSMQLSAVTDVHALQRALIGHVLDGGGLSAIVRTVADTVGGEVAVFSAEGHPVTSYPRRHRGSHTRRDPAQNPQRGGGLRQHEHRAERRPVAHRPGDPSRPGPARLVLSSRHPATRKWRGRRRRGGGSLLRPQPA